MKGAGEARSEGGGQSGGGGDGRRREETKGTAYACRGRVETTAVPAAEAATSARAARAPGRGARQVLWEDRLWLFLRRPRLPSQPTGALCRREPPWSGSRPSAAPTGLSGYGRCMGWGAAGTREIAIRSARLVILRQSHGGARAPSDTMARGRSHWPPRFFSPPPRPPPCRFGPAAAEGRRPQGRDRAVAAPLSNRAPLRMP